MKILKCSISFIDRNYNADKTKYMTMTRNFDPCNLQPASSTPCFSAVQVFAPVINRAAENYSGPTKRRLLAVGPHVGSGT